MTWLRWHEGTCCDGKFQVVARNACVTVATVIAVWAMMLEDAAHPDHRGFAEADPNFYSQILDVPKEEIIRIWEGMDFLKLMEIGEKIRIINWQKRQFETDLRDNTNARRQQRYRDKTAAKRLRNGSVTAYTGPDTDTDTDKKDISIKDDWPNDYTERFWQAYPRKVGKGSAMRKLSAIRKDGEVSFAQLLGAIRKIEASEERFIPHPTTWLNQGRYLDAAATDGKVVDDAEFARMKAKYDEKVARTA